MWASFKRFFESDDSTVDLTRLGTLGTGQNLDGFALKICQTAIKNPNRPIYHETYGGFGNKVVFSNSQYINPGEKYGRVFNTGDEIVTGVIIVDNKTDSNYSPMNVETEGLGTSSFTLKISAPDDRGIHATILISSSSSKKT